MLHTKFLFVTHRQHGVFALEKIDSNHYGKAMFSYRQNIRKTQMKREEKCKVSKSVHHRTIQINHQPDATIFQFIILKFIYSQTCFVLCLWSGLPVRPQTQHGYHHDTKVKPEAATAVISS